MLRKIATLALAAGLVAVASQALATPLYGGNDGKFMSIDQTTGVATQISAPTYNIDALAWDFDNQVMYGGTGTRFFTIAADGTQTTINASTAYNIDGLAFGPGGVLYGTDQNTLFYEIDPSNGAITWILGLPNTRDLAYDQATSTLYGTSGANLYTINPISGVHSLVSAFSGVGGDAVDTIAIDPVTGQMYGESNPAFGGGKLYQINKATGAATFVGQTGLGAGANAGWVFSMAFVPEPGTMLLLGMGLVGLGISGRKKA